MRQILRELDRELSTDAPEMETTFVELSNVETWSELLRCEMRRAPGSEMRSRLLGVAKLAIAAMERIDESELDELGELGLRS